MLVAVVLAFVSVGPPAPPQATLSWHQFKEGDPVALNAPKRYVALKADSAPINGYKTPAGAKKARFFSIVTSATKSIVGVLAATRAEGSYDRVWVDWNQDGQFGEAELAKPVKNARTSYGPNAVVFAFAKPPKGVNGPMRVRLAFVPPNYLTIEPTGYMGAQIDLEGARRTVAVYDTDYDGAVKTPPTAGMSDSFLFYTPVSGGQEQWRWYGGRFLIEIGEGRFWAPQISPTGNKLTFVPDETPTGQVEFRGLELHSLDVIGSQGRIVGRPVGGKVTLPAGRYGMATAEFTIAGAGGIVWHYLLSNSKGFDDIDVAAGAVTSREVGAPLRLRPSIVYAGGRYEFSVGFVDRSGAAVTDLAHDKGDRPAEPTVTVTDPDGNVAAQLSLPYG